MFSVKKQLQRNRRVASKCFVGKASKGEVTQNRDLLSEGGCGFIQCGATVGTIHHLTLGRHDKGQSYTGLACVLCTGVWH